MNDFSIVELWSSLYKQLEDLKERRRKYVRSIASSIEKLHTPKAIENRYPDLVEFFPAEWTAEPTKHAIAKVNLLEDLDQKLL